MAERILDDRQERLLEWLLLPETERVPSTQKAMADELGIAEKTLHAWKKGVAFRAEYDRRWRKLKGGPENVEQVITKLQEKAAEGSAPHAKLYLEWARELRKDDPTDDGPTDLREMSDAELLANLEALRVAT